MYSQGLNTPYCSAIQTVVRVPSVVHEKLRNYIFYVTEIPE